MMAFSEPWKRATEKRSRLRTRSCRLIARKQASVLWPMQLVYRLPIFILSCKIYKRVPFAQNGLLGLLNDVDVLACLVQDLHEVHNCPLCVA